MQLQPIIDSLKHSMKILFTSVSSMNLEPIQSTLDRAKLNFGFDFHLYRFDEGKEAQFHYDGECDHNILRKVEELKPDVIIYSGPAGGKCRPQNDTLISIKRYAKTIGLICDGGCPEWHPILSEYATQNVFDSMVNIDGNPNWPSRPCDHTFVGLIDPAYYGKQLPKTVNFGFCGGDGALSRRQAIEVLKKECGLEVGPRSEDWGTYQNYADFMLKTKCVVNFPETGSQKAFHVKYRVIESALARCCLFERKNPITPLYFEPGKDYVEYESIADLVEKVKSITPDEIAEKAKNLFNKVVIHHSAEVNWAKVFKSL